ncbi:MAG: hypothetical protein RI944_289 [Actinomycetota bacterium]
MRNSDSDSKSIPIFPLNTVLMPGQVMPLHIFENRYRALMSDLLALPEVERRFGIVNIKKGSEVKDDPPVLSEVGTTAVLRKSTTNEDGTFEIIVIGGQRFNLLSVSKDKAPYLVADIKVRKETEPEFDTATLTLAKEKCDEFMMMFDADNDNASQKLPDTPTSLSFLLASLLPINNLEKQTLLELDNPNERLKKVLKIINRETILMQEIPSVPAPFLTKTKISLN